MENHTIEIADELIRQLKQADGLLSKGHWVKALEMYADMGVGLMFTCPDCQQHLGYFKDRIRYMARYIMRRQSN